MNRRERTDLPVEKRVVPVALGENGESLVLLDQTLLPGAVEYLSLRSVSEIREAIYSLKVRGAPAIGIAAAYGIYVSVRGEAPALPAELLRKFSEHKKILAGARPTAVNLSWALERVEKRLFAAAEAGADCAGLLEAMRGEAAAIHEEDISVCRRIGEHGLSLLKPGGTVLTHCNAGALATSMYGTALAPIHLGLLRGMNFKVYADETRPLHQGSRLTAWELSRAGAEVVLICDNMAAHVMSLGKIDAVLVGCDRVAANGDAANKIGTLGVAVSAAHFGVPFYVAAPKSTIDLACASGKDIEIEERPGAEICEKWFEKPMAPEGIGSYNPAFDVTDASLITAFITEDGVVYPPFGPGLAALF